MYNISVHMYNIILEYIDIVQDEHVSKKSAKYGLTLHFYRYCIRWLTLRPKS